MAQSCRPGQDAHAEVDWFALDCQRRAACKKDIRPSELPPDSDMPANPEALFQTDP